MVSRMLLVLFLLVGAEAQTPIAFATFDEEVDASIPGTLVASQGSWSHGTTSATPMPAGATGMSFVVADTTVHAAVGLSEAPHITTGYRKWDVITWCIKVRGQWSGPQRVEIYEAGQARSYGSFLYYEVGDTFAQEVDEAGVVRYYHNGDLFYTSTRTATGSMMNVDVSFYTAGELTDFAFTGGASEQPTQPTNNGPTGAICFTGDSLLTLEGGSTKKFRDLQVGDMILSADRDGIISASPVVFLPHEKNDITRKFDEVTLANGMIVRMTRNHLLPLCDGSLVTARSLKEGDCLMTTSGTSEVATTTQNVEAGGIYTAVTKKEYLVVDGIVASPFALAHGIAHSFFDREDVGEWCKDNAHLVEAAKDEEVQQHRRRLMSAPENNKESGCVELMETLFENYKDEGAGWGTNGWGYKNFKTTLRGAGNNTQQQQQPSLGMRLSGFYE